MLDLVEQGRDVPPYLSVAEEHALPKWFDEPELGSRLSFLARHLEALTGSGSWPVIRQLALAWRDQLINYMKGYQSQQLAAAREEARQRRRKEARMVARQALDVAPALLRPNLPLVEELERLTTDLDTCLQAEKVLGKLVHRLAGSDLAFTEAVQQIHGLRLPDHPDVPVDDLQGFMADLELAAKMEKTQKEGPTPETYATLIHERRRLTKEPLPVLQRINKGCLRGRADSLRGDLSQANLVTAEELGKALQEEAGYLLNQREPDPSRLLKLYWQACWWNAVRVDQEGAEETQEGVKAAWKAAPAFLQQAANTFSQMKRGGEGGNLGRTKRILKGLSTLNLGLARSTDTEGHLWVSLPPLPLGAQYEQLEPPLNASALDDWRREVHNLQQLDVQTPLLSEPDGYDSEHVSEAQDTARRLDVSLEVLQRVWDELDLGLWSTDSSLSQLKIEAQVYVELADSLDRVSPYTKIKKEKAAEGLELLYEGIERLEEQSNTQGFSLRATLGESEEHKAKPFSHWLLESQRLALEKSFRVLQDALATAITNQAAGILKTSKTPKAAIGQLVQLLRRSLWSYDKAGQAIGDAVEQCIDNNPSKREEYLAIHVTSVFIDEAIESLKEDDRVAAVEKIAGKIEESSLSSGEVKQAVSDAVEFCIRDNPEREAEYKEIGAVVYRDTYDDELYDAAPKGRRERKLWSLFNRRKK